MNNNIKKYKNLYYISAIITFIAHFIFYFLTEEFYYASSFFLCIINLILVLAFILLGRKNKLKKFNVSAPIIYLIFFAVMISLILYISTILMIPFAHLMYYYTFILIGYLMLNIYSLLCLSK